VTLTGVSAGAVKQVTDSRGVTGAGGLSAVGDAPPRCRTTVEDERHLDKIGPVNGRASSARTNRRSFHLTNQRGALLGFFRALFQVIVASAFGDSRSVTSQVTAA
jgi:hypothetical protein